MDEDAARLELLKIELQSIQTGIRSLDTTLFQIKGWCVTVVVAVAGFALSNNNAALLLIGFGAIMSFWLIDAHHKALQRVFIERNLLIENEFAKSDVSEALNRMRVLGTSLAFVDAHELGELRRFKKRISDVASEARRPLTFGIYLFLAALLVLQALIIT